MNNQLDDSEKSSRRQFTKTLIAATIATPIIAAACSKPSQDCTCPDAKGQPIKCSFIITGLEPEPHEPPIGVRNGSLSLEMKPMLGTSSETGQTSRPVLYQLATPYYTEIARVQVITEKEKYFLSDYYYLNFHQSYLGLWLQKRTSGGWDPINTSGEPQILFKFVPGTERNLFALETDAPLGRVDSFKPSRPHRYEHPGYGANIHFRLAKWSLFYPTAANVIRGIDNSPFEDDLTNASSGINGFQLAVTFQHVDSRRK